MMPKSTKATKVTDKNKAWNKKSQPSGYKIDCIPNNFTDLTRLELPVDIKDLFSEFSMDLN
jgi:hypothetical protein